MAPTARATRPKKDSIEDEIARLRDLDLKALRARWHGVFRKPAPGHLPKHLVFGLIAYRLQADAFGDLDSPTRRTLGESAKVNSRTEVADQLEAFDRKQIQPEAGSMLMREWNGQKYKVMAMNGGFAWNGKTYKSLSQIAFAITGTRWNGPRFFGLRDAVASEKEKRTAR